MKGAFCRQGPRRTTWSLLQSGARVGRRVGRHIPEAGLSAGKHLRSGGASLWEWMPCPWLCSSPRAGPARPGAGPDTL